MDKYDNFLQIVKCFLIIIYARLSKEEQGKSKEEQSKSIKNQIEICKRFIEAEEQEYPNCKFKIVAILKDDGVSGTTFERDDFNKLIKKIESKQANMVITKDTSRLGRNISQSLYYSTEYFQEKNVRYVALTDGIDTFDKCQNTDMLMFKAFYNEMYVKDISTKIKATLNSQKRNGKFMGGNAPYGYQRNLPYDKHELIIDEEQAEIVKRIYDMFINGMGVRKIANTLTDEKIPIPSIQKNLNRGNKSSVYGVWQERTISDILTNPTYKGDLTQCREYKVSYKSKKRRKNSKENWIIAKGACPAIIDEETFDLVQNMYQKNKNRDDKSQEHLLRGFLICKECGHTISIGQAKWTNKGEQKQKNICYCNYYKKYSRYNVCSPHKLDYDELEKEILKDIRKKCKKYLKTNNFEELLKNNDKMTKIQVDLEKQLAKIQNNIKLQSTYIDSLYKDKLKGLIDEEMFKRQYNNLTMETINLKKKSNEIETKLYLLKNKVANKENTKYTALIKDYLSLKKPSKQLLSSLFLTAVKRSNISSQPATPITFITFETVTSGLYAKHLSNKVKALRIPPFDNFAIYSRASISQVATPEIFSPDFSLFKISCKRLTIPLKEILLNSYLCVLLKTVSIIF